MGCVQVEIVEGPLAGARSAPNEDDAGLAAGTFGARLVFEGVVRRREGEGEIDALRYQAYEPMAQRQIEALAADLIARHGVLALRVEHSRGRVAVGAVSFRLTVWSVHRKEGLAAADEFIDRLKRDVPIWKV
ncbi:hypothetical protein BH11PLA1_BH11PLA1_03490 [soil metagenome]